MSPQPDHTQPPAHSKSFIVMMAGLMSLVALSIDAMLPAFTIMAHDLHVENSNDIQFVISTLFAGLCCGQIFAGSLSDAFGRRKILFIGITLYAIGAAICLIAPDLRTMLIGRFIQGIGGSGSFVTVVSVVRDQFKGRGMARIMSLVMMLFIMVPAFAPAIGQAVMSLGTWHNIFILFILYAITIGGWSFAKLDETLPPNKRTPFTVHNILHAIKHIITTKVTALCIIAVGCTSSMLIAYLSTVQPLYDNLYDMGKWFVYFFAGQSLFSGLSSLINSRFVEKYGMRYMAQRSFALVMVITGATIATHIAIGSVPFPVFIIMGTVMMFSLGLLFGNLNALAMEPMGDMAGIASALIASLSQIIGITCGVIIGQLADGTAFPLAIGAFCLSSFGFMIVAILKRYHVAQ